jgi:hypothetical protein
MNANDISRTCSTFLYDQKGLNNLVRKPEAKKCGVREGYGPVSSESKYNLISGCCESGNESVVSTKGHKVACIYQLCL